MQARSRVVLTILSMLAIVGTLPAGVAAAADLDDLAGDSRAAIEALLDTMGLVPDAVTWQEGARNYAGPRCPGAGWNCATLERPVVQISSGGVNLFEGSSTAASDPNACEVVQSNTTGPNDAVCSLSSTTNGVTQKARITQQNDTGANTATVDVRATIDESVALGLSASFDQTVDQQVQVSQRNGAGSNAATILEDAKLTASARAVSSAVSRQDTAAFVLLEQRSVGGDQTADVRQDHGLTSSFLDVAGNTRQEQQTRATAANLVGYVFQFSDDGDNDADFAQAHTLNAVADGVLGRITELQGSEHGAMQGNIDQDSETGASNYDAAITKSMTADRDAHTAIQLEDPDCCDLLNLVPATPDTCTITMNVAMTGPASVVQEALLHGRAFAEVNCDVSLLLTLTRGTAKQVFTEQRDGQVVDVVIECEANTCVTTDRPGEEPSNAGNLHLAIRNQTNGERFDPVDAQRPNFTSADPGQVLELKAEFHNHTTGPVSDIRISVPLPEGTAFLDCKACVNGTPDPVTGAIVFNRGIGETGGTRSGTFRVVVQGPTGHHTLAATATSSKGGPIASNVVRYWIA